MNKKVLNDYLDNPNRPIVGAEEDALVQLLQEVQELPDQDPGEAYWQHFNQRLEKRLHEQPVAKKSFPWARFRIFAGFALTFAAFALFFLFRVPSNPTGEEDVTLAQLSDEQLTLISQIYLPIEEEELDSEGLKDEEADLLFDIFGEEDLDDQLLDSSPDPDALKELWKLEG